MSTAVVLPPVDLGNSKPVFRLGLDLDLVSSYLKDIGRVPLLTNEEEITLGRQVQDLISIEALEAELASKMGANPTSEQLSKELGLTKLELKRKRKCGARAKERMVAANLRLVVSVAKKYTKRNMELLDLIQEGTLGLVRGVEKFDPTRGYKFSTYAYWWIRQGITRAIAEKSRTIRLPIHITEVLNKLKKGQRELSQKLSRTPTVQELSEYLDLPQEEVKDVMSRASQPVSLQMKVGDSDDTILMDLFVGSDLMPSEKLEANLMKEAIHRLLDKLPDMQAQVMRMRYGIDGQDPMTLTGIGRILGISRDRVRKLERDGLIALKNNGQAVENYLAS